MHETTGPRINTETSTGVTKENKEQEEEEESRIETAAQQWCV